MSRIEDDRVDRSPGAQAAGPAGAAPTRDRPAGPAPGAAGTGPEAARDGPDDTGSGTTVRPGDRGSGSGPGGPGGGDPAVANPPLFPVALRWALLAGGLVVGVTITAWSTTVPADDDGYVLAHAVSSAPFLLTAMACTWHVYRRGPAEYRTFWGRWLGACATAVGATAAGAGSVVWDSQALLALDAALLAGGGPLWVSATFGMVRAQGGLRSVSVDAIDAVMAVVVLGAPALLVVAEPLGRAEHLAFAVPFAVATVTAPASVYLTLVSLVHVPRGERTGFAVGLALGLSFTVNITMQLANVLGDLGVALPVLIGGHTVTMVLLVALPLWTRRRAAGRLASLPAEHQVRASNPMPYVSAVVLPVLALYVLWSQDERPWGVPFLIGVLVALVVLNAVRYPVTSRETRRLYGDLARMAEERRRLLADMLRALEDDRHRTVTELHGQAIRALTTLGTTIQTAYVALPPDTAVAVKEAITQAHSDLAGRAEELRRLMVAMRPPALEPGGGTDSTLVAALQAYASDLGRDRVVPSVDVHVDPELQLDWPTMTIAYRIAQEALRNAARHAGASTVAVRVVPERGGLLVEVRDDGAGFDPEATPPGSGRATMELFTQLGRGELEVRSAPGEGTVVRSLLGVREDAPGGPAGEGRRPRPRLAVVPDPDDERDADA
jgi:signal transduction histidine kinase